MSSRFNWRLVYVIAFVLIQSRWGMHVEHWGAMDWIAYGSLFAGAVVLALETGLSQSPTLLAKLPNVLRHPYWGFVPLILVLIATGAFAMHQQSAPSNSEEGGVANTPMPDHTKNFLQSWGLYPPATYQVTLDAAQISNYKANYRLVLVVRSSFSDRDRLTDRFIEVSNPYTIEDGIMVLAHPSENKLRFLIQGPSVIEYDVAVLPDKLDVNEISTLKSVEDLGGKILASAIQVVGPKPAKESKYKICEILSC